MKVTFPHMGSLFLPMKSLFRSLELDIILPPPITQKTIEIGSKHSPEFACFPLKINVGNFIEALEEGADTIVMLGGVGPCRFGYYAEVQKRILKSLGYDFKMIVIEPPRGNLKEMLKELNLIRNNISWNKVLNSIQLTYKKIRLLDELDKKVKYVRPRTTYYREIDNIEKEFQDKVLNIESNSQLDELLEKTEKTLDQLINKNFEPIKIALVGEIYMVLERTANMEIEKLLGESGAQVSRGIYLSDWIIDNVVCGSLGLSKNKEIKEAAKPYISRFVGGHGQETVGEAVLKAQEGYDGIVHLLPFTCTPEIIAQSVMPKVSKDLDIPFLTIVMDEHKGVAGLKTRIEAFTDMLHRKNQMTAKAT
ncbi:2-hydroxyacyl-CoA dehydratase [Natranaerobius trueperi]|uniref:CoA protein activase n=1 Tax=Natranaerobius trueperi TaxID=759412 RepID=A0A226BY98_9FIRM|nr:2-hydroxyacyl-CoA dehydratase [Natranaerobius trueperi]OWZ83976.1 CoA protein activase [Natranaerobius trueperi]